MQTCPECETIYLTDSVEYCSECGYVFPEWPDDDEFDDDQTIK